MTDERSDADTELPPVVFIPGVGHPAAGWQFLRRHLDRAGFRHTSAFPASHGCVDIPHLADQLARHVESLLVLSGSGRVHLVGHNVGGVVARYFVQVLGGDACTASVVTVETPHAGTTAAHAGWGVAAAQLRPGSAVLRRLEETIRPMGTRWISYFGDRDLFVQPTSSAVLRSPLLRTTNLLVEGHTHLSLVIPPAVSRSIAHQIAALERLPGYGNVVASSPAFARLADASDGGAGRAARRALALRA